MPTRYELLPESSQVWIEGTSSLHPIHATATISRPPIRKPTSGETMMNSRILPKPDQMIGATPPEIVWTSGATEGNNLAIKGAAEAQRARGNHLVTVSTEHKAVLDTVHDLERRGFTATILDPEADGLVDLAKL